MKTGRIALALVAIGLIASACSKGSSLQDYFEEVQAIRSTADQAGDELQSSFEADAQAAQSEEETLVLLKDFLEEVLAIGDEAAADLEAIAPPSEAEAAHGEMVVAVRDAMGAFHDAVDNWDQYTQNPDSLEQLFTGDIAELQRAEEAACNELQALADDNDIEVEGEPVDLACAI